MVQIILFWIDLNSQPLNNWDDNPVRAWKSEIAAFSCWQGNCFAVWTLVIDCICWWTGFTVGTKLQSTALNFVFWFPRRDIASHIFSFVLLLPLQMITLPPEESLDLIRTLRMASYGMLISGPSLHFWFNFVSKVVPKKDVLSTFKKMFLGQAVYGPIINCVFFSYNAGLQGIILIRFSVKILKLIQIYFVLPLCALMHLCTAQIICLTWFYVCFILELLRWYHLENNYLST
jgi:hypothetical protein